MFREKVLDLIRQSPVIASLYGGFTLLLGRSGIIRNPYQTIQLLLDARRRIPDLAKTEKHGALIRYLLEKTTMKDGELLPCNENKLIKAFNESKYIPPCRKVFIDDPLEDRRRLRHHRGNDTDPTRQGHMILLKIPNRETGEKGVLALKYTPTFGILPALFDLPWIVEDYRIVFEPSWYRNIEASLFLYSGKGKTHIFQCAQHEDTEILRKLPHSLKTIDLGAGDWIDFEKFAPNPHAEKKYDVAMVAAWTSFKRHDVVIRALAQWKKQRPDFRAVFVGYPAGMTKEDIVLLTRKHGIESNVTFFEQIKPEKVADVLSSSRMSIHFSKAEGANKVAYESWLCNIPMIVYKHNIGFRHNWINEKTGIHTDEEGLADAFEYIYTHPGQFSPREWVLERSGYINATRILNETLKEIALEKEEPWTVDIVPKKNAPNFYYANEEDRLKMEPYYQELDRYFSNPSHDNVTYPIP